MERQACEIRLRAERRAGQLLAEMEKAKGGAQPGVGRRGMPSQESSALPQRTLGDLGISHNQSSQWQKLAKVPDDEFEKALQSERPSTSGIIAASAPKPEPRKNAVNDHALWLWGRLNDIDTPDGPKRLRMVAGTQVAEREGRIVRHAQSERYAVILQAER